MVAVTATVAHAPGASHPTDGTEPIWVSLRLIVASVDRKTARGASPPWSPTLHTVTETWTLLFGRAEGGPLTDCTVRSGPFPTAENRVESCSRSWSGPVPVQAKITAERKTDEGTASP